MQDHTYADRPMKLRQTVNQPIFVCWIFSHAFFQIRLKSTDPSIHQSTIAALRYLFSLRNRCIFLLYVQSSQLFFCQTRSINQYIHLSLRSSRTSTLLNMKVNTCSSSIWYYIFRKIKFNWSIYLSSKQAIIRLL